VRRRPPSRVTSSTRRAVVPAHCSVADSFTLVLETSAEEPGPCTAGAGPRDNARDSEAPRCRALQDAIHQVTQKFEEAQQEYQGVIANSPAWHKWKGEMIAYANVVAILEDLKSRYVLVR
jgi:hypothetical protein